MEKRQQVLGLYFGTFNPPHLGHLEIIKELLRHCDSLLVIPSAQPPGKRHVINSFEDRFQMMESMISEMELGDRIQVSPVENNLPKPSYTYNTLVEIKNSFPDAKLVLITGSDNWMNLDKWYKSKEVIELVDFLVYPRNSDLLMPETKMTILEVPEIDISSSQIRSFTETEVKNTPWLTAGTKEYILKNNLYGRI